MDPIIESCRYVVLGSVDAGKTSFVSVMKNNVLDNGNGSARSSIVKTKHEMESGRTSTHSFHYIIKKNEVTTLIDLCGHEKYLKTTIFGITGLFTDYGIVMIGSNMGINTVTKEHLGLLISNKIPYITILTKIDMCPSNIMSNVKKELEKIAKNNKKEIIYFEKDEEEINGSYLKDEHRKIINLFHDRNLSPMPVVMVSNKTGHNINFIRELITSIKSITFLEKMELVKLEIDPKIKEYPAILYIDNVYNVTGIGIVISGAVKYGSFSLGQKIYLGPIDGKYINVTVKSLQNCIGQNIDVLQKDQSGSIGIRLDTKGSYYREMYFKGQIATADLDFAVKHTHKVFNCCVAIFNHHTTIKNGYQAVIHSGVIRQTGQFIMKEGQILRSESKENIDVEFMARSEFILPDTYFMFRDGRIKGIGKIINFSK